MAAREDALASLSGRLRPLTAPLRRAARAPGNPARTVEGMKTMHAQTRNAAHAITAQLIVDQEKRAEVLSNRFARYMLMVEDSIYMSMRRIVPDFRVGYPRSNNWLVPPCRES